MRLVRFLVILFNREKLRRFKTNMTISKDKDMMRFLYIHIQCKFQRKYSLGTTNPFIKTRIHNCSVIYPLIAFFFIPQITCGNDCNRFVVLRFSKYKYIAIVPFTLYSFYSVSKNSNGMMKTRCR